MKEGGRDERRRQKTKRASEGRAQAAQRTSSRPTSRDAYISNECRAHNSTQTITVGRKLKTAKDDTDPIRVKARQINNEIAAPKIQRLACATKPTWTLRPPVIDTTLREVVRGEGDPTRRRTLVEDHIHTLGAFKEATRDGHVSH